MADRVIKPDSGNELVLEDAGSTDRLRITDGGSTILYEDGGAASLTIDTSGNTEFAQNIEQADGKNIQTDEVRARDGDGLKLYEDGGSGIFIENGGSVGIGTTGPTRTVDIAANVTHSSNGLTSQLTIRGTGDSTQKLNVAYDTTSNYGFIEAVDENTVHQNLSLQPSGGSVGIRTTAPGQILDCNQGSGNMIADGYDQHSLAIYKENIEPASGYLDKVLACPAQKWNGKPFISADEIKEAVLAEFSETVWKEYFPEDDSHRQKALYNMPEGELKTWINNWCEAKRVEMRPEAKWQKKRLGLVADAELTAEHLPEVISINDDGETTGIDTMTYIGILHNALSELSAKVNALKNA